MNAILSKILALFIPAYVALAPASGYCTDKPLPVKIHSVTDISHEFTFYFDGRFARNYLGENGIDARNWATLHKYDLDNVNLLILQSGASPCPYLPADTAEVQTFLAEGGGVVVLGDYALFHDEKQYRLNELTRQFGAEFVNSTASGKLSAAPELCAENVRSYRPKTIRLADPACWKVLINDANGQVVMALRTVGKGKLLVASRALCGNKPDASDPINEQWLKPLLQQLAANKPIDPNRPLSAKMPENVETRSGLRIRYSDYMQPFADAVFELYQRCRPAMEHILGVGPSQDMLTGLILLPTGGGGFSSGRDIGIGVWWGGFPQKQYGMVELLGHEGTHSWVLPFAEPMWNEGIATYVGILLARQLGIGEEADRVLKCWIDSARRLDPDMTKYDIAAGKVPHEVAMAKPMWIFEQLRQEKPDILAQYFQTKRRLIDPVAKKQYTADDCVAVLSIAMGRDLFGWFRSLGISVDRARTTVAMEL